MTIPAIVAAGALAAQPVVNRAGEKLGSIAEFMVDAGTGRIAYAVLSHGGLMGIGEKLFAIPWSAFELDPETHGLILDIPAEGLDAAPGFDKDHWPTMADPAWHAELHAFYRRRPYWEAA